MGSFHGKSTIQRQVGPHGISPLFGADHVRVIRGQSQVFFPRLGLVHVGSRWLMLVNVGKSQLIDDCSCQLVNSSLAPST